MFLSKSRNLTALKIEGIKMIDIIALLIATAVIDSPLSHTSAAATSSALKSTISAPAPMTPEQRL